MGSALVYLIVMCGVGLCIVVGACFFWYLRAPVQVLRATHRVSLIGMRAGESVEVGLEQPDIVRVERLPGFAVLLLLLHEDDLFFAHSGVNTREVLNRIRAYFCGRGPLAGGSSLSQQLAKHLFSQKRRRRTFGRWLEKLRELMYAIKLERSFTKEELATLYINSVRFGPDPIVGIRKATDTYFRKQPEQCTLHEFLFLFGLIPAPTTQIARLVRDGTRQFFPLKTAFIKCVDLMRLVTLTFGWGMLDRLHTLSFRDIVAVAREMKQYNPGGLSPEFELALEVRALEEVARIDEAMQALLHEPMQELAAIRDGWLKS